MGTFENRRVKNILNVLGMVLGFGLALVLSVIDLLHPKAIAGNTDVLWIASAVGALAGCLCAAYLPYNRHAHLTLDENGLSARFGWRTMLNCTYGEIDCCVAEQRSLLLTLRGSRKIYCIKHLINSREIGREIDLQTQLLAARGSVDFVSLEQNLPKKRTRRSLLRWASLLLFLSVFGAALLMRNYFGGSDAEMAGEDWLALFLYAALIVAVVYLGEFWSRAYKILDDRVQQDERQLRRRLMLTAPLPPGDFYGVYADLNFRFRTVLFQREDGSFEGIVQEAEDEKQLAPFGAPEYFADEDMEDFFTYQIPLS